MSKVWLAILLAIAAGPAAAQGVPGNPGNPGDFSRNPHPAMPWAGDNPNHGAFDYGHVVQYIPVPAEQVEIQLPVSLPDGVPAQTRPQVVEIPGYYVTETTTGYWYPEHWTLQQLNAGVYQWVRVPAEWRRK